MTSAIPVLRYRRGHGFESRLSLNFFFQPCFSKLLKLSTLLRWSFICQKCLFRITNIWISYIHLRYSSYCLRSILLKIRLHLASSDCRISCWGARLELNMLFCWRHNRDWVEANHDGNGTEDFKFNKQSNSIARVHSLPSSAKQQHEIPIVLDNVDHKS